MTGGSIARPPIHFAPPPRYRGRSPRRVDRGQEEETPDRPAPPVIPPAGRTRRRRGAPGRGPVGGGRAATGRAGPPAPAPARRAGPAPRRRRPARRPERPPTRRRAVGRTAARRP